jgi:hypothetical protein
MVAMTTYTVTAERGAGPVWVFQCREFPGAISQSRRLADGPRLMREAIAFVADVAPETVQVELVPALPSQLWAEVERAKQAVRELEARQREVAALSRNAARHLKEEGLSGADAAAVLGVSPQRVSQLVSSS